MNVAVIGGNSNYPEITQRIIEILDKKYVPIVVKETDSSISKMIALASLFDGISSTPTARPNVNIITEFELIQKKQSKLSKSNRDWVIRQFNKYYKEIK